MAARKKPAAPVEPVEEPTPAPVAEETPPAEPETPAEAPAEPADAPAPAEPAVEPEPAAEEPAEPEPAPADPAPVPEPEEETPVVPETSDYIGPDPSIDHPEPTEPPVEPEGFGLADILVTVEGGEAKTLEDWQADDREVLTVSATSLDGDRVFDFDDRTHHPRDVVVYTNGRPA